MKKNTIISLIIALIILIAGVVYLQPNTQTNQTSTQEVVKFGALVPLTGSIANLGGPIRDSMLMAVEDINTNGGINGKRVEIYFEDTQCDPGKAVTAVNKLITVNKVIALSTFCSGESLSTAKILNENKILTISPGATNTKLTTEGGDFWFRIAPNDNFQSKVAAKYATETLNAKQAAILYINNDWGIGLRDNFKKAFEEKGGKIIATEGFEGDTTDVRSQISKIKAANSDIVYLLCYPKECGVALKQMYELGLKVQILGADAADDSQILNSIAPAAEGFTLTVPSAAGENFNSKFKSKFGKDATAYTGQAYDVISIMAKAATQAGADGTKMKDYLYTLKYNGFSGEIAFDVNGDLVSGKYDLKQWTNGTSVLLKQIQAQ